MSCSGQKRRFENAPTTSGSSRSSIGAFSHSLISRSTCQSTMRRATDFKSSSCGIESIRVRMHLTLRMHPHANLMSRGLLR